MANHLRRSVKEPIRRDLTWDEMWAGPDNGLIFCWERGREERLERADDAERADRGELVGLTWKGGVKKKLRVDLARGTLQYLATWQGIRGNDLDLDTEGETILTCTRTKQAVCFSSRAIVEEE